MQNDLRIIFMGTPDFAVGVLKKLLEEGKNVVAVVTAPDKPAGRGRKLQSSAVKEFAISQNIPVLQPTNLKDETFLSQLKSFNADLQIVVAFRMLPKVVWQLPKLGTFNLHASLLPQYRGAAPINWAIMNAEEKTGVTTFFIDEKIDTGEIILRKEVSIEHRETAGTLHDKLMEAGSNLVVETVTLIEKGTVSTEVQKAAKNLKEASKLTAENTKIDWQQPAENIDVFIRGLSPYPVAWAYLLQNGKKEKVKIYASEIELTETTEHPGTIITSKKTIKVAAKNGFVTIRELQLPGKRKMDAASLLNGFSFEKDAIFC